MIRRVNGFWAGLLPAVLASPIAMAGGVSGQATLLDPIYVNGVIQQPLGDVDSATVGTVYAEQFQNRPLSRPGELLEVVPGLIVTQHSGEGKANQYFLRGFNLDHGTDFATFIDGMPVNLPTHAHGQGYSDNNFLVPELVDNIVYRKGPYYAQYGDFSAAGAADINLRDSFESKTLQFTGGEYGYARGLAAGSYKVLGGDLLYSVLGTHYDGAYIKNDNFNNENGLLRYSRHSDLGEFHITVMGYNARFDSTDQIPQLAIDRGLVDRLGCFDGGCSDGGKTHRYSFSAGFNRRAGPGEFFGSAYAFRYKLDLYSDFSYYLLDPVRGDQFEQFDARNVYGGKFGYKLPFTLFGLTTASEIGVQTRYDNIGTVGLYDTEDRARFGTVSQDHVREWSIAEYAQTSVRLTPWLVSTADLRFDNYTFDIDANDPANSGTSAKNIAQPKLTFVAGPFYKSEVFLNLGKGFHSNDGRGTTEIETYDPRTNTTTPTDKVTPLVATRGADLGLRTYLIPHVQATASLFILDIDSELTFNGDEGDTSPSGPSRRVGTELSIYWRPLPHLVIDSDYAYTHARFRDVPEDESRIGEAATSVFAFGATYESPLGWFTAARLRYFGPRPIDDDGSTTASSKSTKVVNLDGGYTFSKHFKAALQIINLLDSHDHDIDYYFPVRLTGPNVPAAQQDPAAGINTDVFHPIEPFNVRAVLTYNY
jgi:outer membrane receptor protein involved in Fe transport